MFRAGGEQAQQVDLLFIRTLVFALEQVTRTVLSRGTKDAV